MLNWLKNKFKKEEASEKVKKEKSTIDESVSTCDESSINGIQKESREESTIPEEMTPMDDVQEEAKEESSSTCGIPPRSAIQEEKKEDPVTTYDESPVDTLKEELKEDSTTTCEVPITDVVQEKLEEESTSTCEVPPVNTVDEGPKKKSLFQRLKSGLTKTRDDMEHKINQVLGVYVKVDDEMMEDLEDILIASDMGMKTTMEVIDRLKEELLEQKIKDPTMVKPVLKQVIKNLMEERPLDHVLHTEKSPTVILVIGVNGVGKTTTIGKLAYQLKESGKSVLIAAADTFRAAAIDQLKTWGERSNVDVIAHSEGSDPTAVVFDGIQAAKARKSDVLICDTAGRLHNKSNLMKELEKIYRIINREFPEAKKETLLVLDATTGQNAMIQAKTFNEATDITGIALTKLDGTAKGGVVIALQRELEIPIKLIGVGEKIEDLQVFNTEDFVDALFDSE